MKRFEFRGGGLDHGEEIKSRTTTSDEDGYGIERLYLGRARVCSGVKREKNCGCVLAGCSQRVVAIIKKKHTHTHVIC